MSAATRWTRDTLDGRHCGGGILPPTTEEVHHVGRLDGKVAVITGGASGIGAATARRFIAEGARVLLADLQERVADELAAALGPDAASIHCNVAQEADVAAAIRTAVERWGRLDVLYNNAG